MKIRHICLCILICLGLLLSLAGCGSNEDNPSVPTGSTSGSAVSVPTASAPTEAPLDWVSLYDAAAAEVSGAENLVLEYDLKCSRAVGGETYTEGRAGTAAYSGMNTEAMEALVSENFTCGSYSTQYIESYLAGSGWCRVSNCSYRCDMTAEAFLAQQLPAVLLDRGMYENITAEKADGSIILSFDAATAVESWVTGAGDAQLTAASGQLVLDASGHLTAGSYHVEFTRMTTAYTLDVSVSVTLPEVLDFSAQQPVYPEACPVIDDLQALRYMIRAVGDVYTSRNMSVSCSDRIDSEAQCKIRTQSSSYNTYGSGDDFLAMLSSAVSIADYTGAAATNSNTILYQDGQCTHSVNGSEPTVNSTTTAEALRISCEDYILSALMTPEYIAGAQVTDTGDFLCIRFTGNEAFAESICDSIYSLFSLDLDLYASSYTTEYAEGYLTVNKYTGLPTAMGMRVSRRHIIDGISYKLTYQQDQSLELSSDAAYEAITGEALPSESAEGASPLFYKVTGADGQALWLLGTVHVGDERTANLPQSIQDAFAGSDALAVEYDINSYEKALAADAPLLQQVMNTYCYSDGSAVSSHVSKELYTKLSDYFLISGSNSISAPYLKAGIWENFIENFFLRQCYTLSLEECVDCRLLDWAEAQSKPIRELESGLTQLQRLSGLSDQIQSMLLENTLSDGLKGYYDSISALYELWCRGDEAALTAALGCDTTGMSEEAAALFSQYYKITVTDRNASMLAAAKGYLESDETVFFAVDLSHLLGEDGLIAALRSAGYTVEQIR